MNEHTRGLYCNGCGEKWPCPSISAESICERCQGVIEPGTIHNMFNGNQMFACAVRTVTED